MEAAIIEYPFGLLAFDKENQIIGKELFSKRPNEAAETFAQVREGKIQDEVIDLIKTLQKKGYDHFILENAKLANEIKKKLYVKVHVSHPFEAGEILASQMERFAVETGFAKNADTFYRWMHNVALETAKLRVKEAVKKRDLIIIQAIQTLDDIDKTLNRFMSRVREWYGIHFPELDRLLSKHETYARLVYELGSRENFTEKMLEKEGISPSKTKVIVGLAETSMGADLSQMDLLQIQSLCKNILNQYQLRERFEHYLELIMKEVAPNIEAIVGPLLGARLIALAGGLTSLAKMPSSTIQVLGAEKALFRSLKTGTSPPKHGIIFQHTLLHEAEKRKRGKIARAMAGKLAIAARADAFGSRLIGEQLKASLERRIEEIQCK